jgi:large subunit ribosomal protein L21
MYAIVEFKGTQLRVEKGKSVRVPYIAELEKGATVEIPRVLLFQDDAQNTLVGRPVVENAKVVGEVIDHYKDRKVIVFKKRRRKGYATKNGHRQNWTTVLIRDIAVA